MRLNLKEINLRNFLFKNSYSFRQTSNQINFKTQKQSLYLRYYIVICSRTSLLCLLLSKHEKTYQQGITLHVL